VFIYQALLDVIDLCSTTSASTGDDEISFFSPVKPETDPANTMIPDNDYHDSMKSLPMLARPKLGLIVFTLMIGTYSANHMPSKA
jgi:hypothetical protein